MVKPALLQSPRALSQNFSMSDKPALQPGLAVGEALCAVARDILGESRAAIEDPAHSDAVAVHEFRRSMKRWRAFLRLLEPFLEDEGRRLRNEARDLARSLGGARDAQSALDALEDLAKHGAIFSTRSLATMRERIAALRQTAETVVLTPDMRLRMTGTLDQAEAAVERWPLHTLIFADVADRLVLGFRDARRALPRQWSQTDPEDLHELRKRIVNHRYQMETVAPLWPRFGRMWVGEAQRLRDRLGRHQDLTLLAALTQPHQPLAPWRSRLTPAIAERMKDHVAAARRIASRLFVEKPGAFRRRLDVIWEMGD
jgi:CHAD domain-containing protein